MQDRFVIDTLPHEIKRTGTKSKVETENPSENGVREPAAMSERTRSTIFKEPELSKLVALDRSHANVLPVDDRVTFRGGSGFGDQGTVLRIDNRERFTLVDVMLDSGVRIQIIEGPDWKVQSGLGG